MNYGYDAETESMLRKSLEILKEIKRIKRKGVKNGHI